MRWHGLPGCSKDLASLPALCDHGYTFVFSPTGSRSIAILPDKREFVISRTGHHADGTKMWRMSYEVDTKTNSIRHVAPPDSMLPTGTTASSFLAEQERLRESQQTSSTTPVHAFICPVSTGIGDNDLLPYSAESGDVRCRVSKPDGLISPKPRQTGTRSCIA